MRLQIWLYILLGLQAAGLVHSKAVFAHFMVTNSQNYTTADWKSDMQLAKDAHIDAFALNMAYQDKTNIPSLKMAFSVANSVGFKLLFSFDYAGNGPWDKDVVINMIQEYGSNGAYFQYKSKPLVSTFEGPDRAADWVAIKQKTNCFFIPDWSSLGAKAAVGLAGGVADGLFNWAAWPWGNQTMDTYTDASYYQSLKGKPYMMPISPWFYTNLPGYGGKNWLWKGDSLWFDRWQQILALNPLPEFIQILSWNDYGESHYIGPLHDHAFEAFVIGKAPYNFAKDMPHDGWREILPFVIDQYKTGVGTIKREGFVFWYRRHPASRCTTGRTTGNTASHLQLEFDPADVVDDRLYVTALLHSSGGAMYTQGKGSGWVDWHHVPDGPGLWHGSIPFHTGDVTIQLFGPDDSLLAQADGIRIADNCTNDIQNYNAWVGSAWNSFVWENTTSPDLADLECVEGWGAYDFNPLCKFTCSYGYCPLGACTCSAMGEPKKKPNATGIEGYPAEGKNANYKGLCSFACNYGFCPSATCGTVPFPAPIPTVSDFLPPACVAGTGAGNSQGLCSYSCGFGFCPLHVCKCTQLGHLVEPPPITGEGGRAADGMDSSYDKLCDFTCSRGYCPSAACQTNNDFSAHFPDDTCDQGKRDLIEEEISYAISMADAAQSDIEKDGYYSHFFPDTLRDEPDFSVNAQETFRRIGIMLRGKSTDYQVRYTCNNASPGCGLKWMAHMNDKKKTMNFCNRFFTETGIKNTKDRLSECSTMDLQDAHRLRSTILIHECTHTSYAMLGGKKSLDYGYGYTACYLLPRGLFDRSCVTYKGHHSKPFCPDNNGNEGVCDKKLSAQNADTWAFVAAGVYFSKKCNRAPPFPSRSHAPKSSCPNLDDYLLIDGDDDISSSVKGYVHFGDSFAAGMGTGTTSSDSCRVGSNNYGNLLYQSLGDKSIPYERKVCSGDTLTGLNRQIDGWKQPTVPTLGTLTMGGNDLGFSEMVKYCVLNPYTVRFGSTVRGWCVDAEEKARNLMKDPGPTGLTHKLKEAYQKILSKSGRRDFHLYVTSYVRFFNSNTTDCENSSFHAFWGGYNPPWDWPASRIIYLTKDLRSELNTLVDQLNDVINAAVTAANREIGVEQVHFVNVQPYFDKHRWCEEGPWHEPDETVKSTYFFLGNWHDFPIPEADVNTEEAEAAEMAALIAAGSIQLPNPTVCRAELGRDPDPYKVSMCVLAETVSEDPTGPAATRVANANKAIADRNFTSQDISWFYPTRQIKTFHPRTPGMALFRDAIIEAILGN